MDIEIPAISLWQPWAHLIAIQAKRFETRSWCTCYRGPMAIHAAKHWTKRTAAQCYEEPFFTVLSWHGVRFPARLPSGPEILGLAVGCVVAVAELMECWPSDAMPYGALTLSERAFGDFSHDRYAWQYRNVVRLDPPIPCVGRQGLFRVRLPTALMSSVPC